jgi:hypothetical protein
MCAASTCSRTTPERHFYDAIQQRTNSYFVATKEVTSPMNRTDHSSQFSWRILLLLSAIYPFLASPAAAQGQPPSRPLNADYPASGFLLDTKEHAAIQFICSLAQGSDTLHCDFTRTHIRTALDPSDLQRYIADQVAAFEKDGPMDKKECPEFSQQLAAIDTAAGLDDHERKYLKALFQASLDLCLDFSQENLQKFANLDAERKLNTYKVSMDSYDMEFKKPVGSKNTWVATNTDRPGTIVGFAFRVCGGQQLDRFEEDPTLSNQYMVGWSFHLRTVIANPGASYGFGKCSELEEPDRELNNRRTQMTIGSSVFDFSP